MPGQTQCPIRMRSSRKSRIWRRDGRWPRHMTSPAASSLGKPGTASSLSARRHLEVFKYLKKGLVAYGTLRSKGVCLAEPDGSALSGKCDMAHRAFCCLAERQRKEGGRLTTHSIQHQAIRSVPACPRTNDGFAGAAGPSATGRPPSDGAVTQTPAAC